MATDNNPTRRFRWNAVCVGCAPDEFEHVVSFCRDMLRFEVADGGGRWKMLVDPLAV